MVHLFQVMNKISLSFSILLPDTWPPPQFAFLNMIVIYSFKKFFGGLCIMSCFKQKFSFIYHFFIQVLLKKYQYQRTIKMEKFTRLHQTSVGCWRPFNIAGTLENLGLSSYLVLALKSKLSCFQNSLL